MLPPAIGKIIVGKVAWRIRLLVNPEGLTPTPRRKDRVDK